MEVVLPGLGAAAVGSGVAGAERILRVGISLLCAALEGAVARAVVVVLPGVARAAVLGSVANTEAVLQPGLSGAAVNSLVASAEAVGSPSIAWAAFSV